MQPPPFVLNCLGTPRLLTAGGQEVRIKVKKHLAVLIILAVDGGKIRRERLVSMLWPTARPDRARGSVATAISVLRAKLGGETIEPGRDWVQLRRGCLALDLDRLVEGDVLGNDFTPPLEVNSFLAGFEIEQTPEFETWKERQHARLLPAVEKGLTALAAHARRSGNLSDLAAHADRLLEINDLSEAGVMASMQAHALSGDRITALRLYEDWSRRLQDEVKTRPTRSIEILAGRLRGGKGFEVDASHGTHPVQTEQWRNQHFIGRSREYRSLYDAWYKTLAGSPQHVLITGDSGVGKTTLADRFSTAVALEGGCVARARCFELESGIPFATIGGLIAPLLESPGVAGASPLALAELGRVLPEISKRFPGLPRPMDATGEDARLQFIQAAVQLFESILEEKPILLVVDDYEQSDSVSLGALHLIVRRLTAKGLMLVLTTRTGATTRRGEPLRLRAGVEDLGIARLEVEPLGLDESEHLLSTLLTEQGLHPTAAERNALIRASGGFPLAIELLVRDWHANGTRSTVFAIQALTKDVQASPESRYQRLTESLLADLDDTERLVAHVAAVLDRRVGELGLYRVAGLPQVTTLATLARLLERRALRDTPAGLEWVNPSVRAHAYLAIPTAIRRALHEGILDELLARDRGGSKAPGLELAWHSVRAGRLKEASSYMLDGAREALLAGAAREAELALLSGMPVFDSETRQEATLCLAEIRLELGQPEDVLEIVKPLIDPATATATRANLLQLRAIAAVNGKRSDTQEMEGVMARLLAIGRSSDDPSLRARAVSIGLALERGFSPSQLSREFLALGSLLPREELSPVDAVELFSSLAKQHYYSRDLDPCEVLLKRALAIADEAGIRNGHYLYAINGLGAVASAKGDYPSALRHSLQLFHASQAAGVDSRTLLASGNVGLCYLRLGDFRQAKAWADRIPPVPLVGLELWLTRMEIAGISRALLAERVQALAIAEELLAFGNQEPGVAPRRSAFLLSADILLSCDDHRRALEAGTRAVAEGHPLDDDPGNFGKFVRWLGSISNSADEIRAFADNIVGASGSKLDELDGVELLTTLAAHGCATDAERHELEVRRARLPAATVAQLIRLTSLQPGRQHVGSKKAYLGTERYSGLAAAATKKEAVV